MSTENQRKFCGVKKRSGPGTCRLPAGWGTDHVGEGRCRWQRSDSKATVHLGVAGRWSCRMPGPARSLL